MKRMEIIFRGSLDARGIMKLSICLGKSPRKVALQKLVCHERIDHQSYQRELL